METDRIKRMILREELREDCQRHLRAQELTAYGEFMNALRMSGGIDDPKREVIDTVKKWLHIPEWRHQAEIRRVASDERMTLIANTLSGEFTSEDWVEEGYDSSKPGTSSMICPIISDRELVLKVIERRLKMHGVDVVSDDDEEEETINSTSESVEADSIIMAAKILSAKEDPVIATAEPEILKEAIETAAPYSSVRAFMSNLEPDEDLSSENQKKRRRDSRSASPDITSLSDSTKRKNSTLQELMSRLSHSSVPDLERIKRKAEREKLLKEKAEKLRMRGGGKKQISSRALIPDEAGRARRETSAASSSSSCLSTSEAIEQFQAVMAANPIPRPSRGRGLSRVRGRGGSQTSGRGRGRGRGRPPSSSLMDNTRPWPMESPPQHLFPSDTPLSDLNAIPTPKPRLSRGLKAKANGEEVKKRTPYKRKKPNFEHLPIDNNFNETPPGDLNEGQRIGQEAHLRDQLKTGQPYDQHFPHGNRQYYDSYNYDSLRPGYNPNSQRLQPQLPQHHHHHYQQEPETPSKIRHKTKHTVIIQDPHESLPVLPKPSPSFIDYSESNLRHQLPNLSASAGPPPATTMSSVIVRTPSVTHSGNSPPKIINPMGMSKTHVTITQNPKSIYYSPTKGHPSPYDGQHTYNSSAPPPNVPPTFSNNLTHKKRTQNLAAATTYTPRSDFLSYSSSDGNNSEVGQQFHPSQTPISSSTGIPSSAAATASSLAVRSRQSYDAKQTAPSSPAINPPLAPVTSVARTVPVQSNSTPPVVHQRKAQPHILATSKIQRNAAAAAASAAGTSINSNSGTTTPVPGSPASTSSNSSVTSNLIPGGSSPSSSFQIPNSTATNLISAASSVVGKTNVPLASSPVANLTRGPSPNIIFVQKNPNPSLPGQVIPTIPSTQPGAMVKGPGKAVILRRANNSNLMILDLQNKQLVGTSPVSQLLNNSRLGNPPQVVKQASVSGATPIRKIIQTAGGRMLSPSTKIITSSNSSANPARTTRIFTTQSGTSVAISVATPAQTNFITVASQITLNQPKPVMAIRPIGNSSSTAWLNEAKSPASGHGHRQGYSGIDLLGQHKSSAVASSPSHPPIKNCGTENDGSSNVPVLNHSNSSSTDTASEGEISSSLLSNEVMESSPPPVNDEEGNQESFIKTPETTEQFQQPVPSTKTRISVVTRFSDSTSPERGYGGGMTSILNQALLSNKSINRGASMRQMIAQPMMRGGNEDEFEEDDDEEEEPAQNISATSTNTSQSSYAGQDPTDQYVEEEEDEQFDSNEDEEDEEIELIDLADS